MKANDSLKHLESLAHLDIDAVFAYQEAIENIDVTEVREQLTQFKQDHERHIKDLSDVISRMGGTPPKRKPDFKGFLIEGFTKVRSASGTEGALRAMKTNETLTNRKYNEAMSWDFSGDVKELIRRNFEDEKRHLSYVEQMIQKKIWEKSKVA